jgi:hypothetical protein
VLRARLLEMVTKYRYAALVVEANYADLVDPKRSHFYSSGLVAEVIAELSSAFPGLQVAFCSNRKFAAEWVERYFTSIAGLDEPPLTSDLTDLVQTLGFNLASKLASYLGPNPRLTLLESSFEPAPGILHSEADEPLNSRKSLATETPAQPARKYGMQSLLERP